MRKAGFLVGQRHDASKDWARETRPTEAIFIIFRDTGVARRREEERIQRQSS